MALDVVWDMETSDPDDFLTLIFLAGHPDYDHERFLKTWTRSA